MMTVFSNNKGFTLLETLLAFFIFAILFTTIYASYSGSIKTINMTEARLETYRKAAIVMDGISGDLQASYISILPLNSFGNPAGYTRFLGEDKDFSGSSADTMSFFTRIGPLFSNKMEMATGQLISYDVVQGNEEGELVLLRSENSEFIDDTEGREGLTLCDGLQGITFTYFNDDGDPNESWDSDSEEFEGSLPRMVSVSLEFLNYENPDAPLTFMTSIALPVQHSLGLQNDGTNNGTDNGTDNTFTSTKRRGIRAISDAHQASNDSLKDAT